MTLPANPASISARCPALPDSSPAAAIRPYRQAKTGWRAPRRASRLAAVSVTAVSLADEAVFAPIARRCKTVSLSPASGVVGYVEIGPWGSVGRLAFGGGGRAKLWRG